MSDNLDSDVTAEVNILGESHHLGDKINFVLDESNGHIVGFLLGAGPGNEINPEKYTSTDKIIVYATGYRNNGIYEIPETDITLPKLMKTYWNSVFSDKEFDWE